MTELYRKIWEEIEDYYKRSDNALLLTGARQTGKTHLARKLGKEFDCFVEINFVERPNAIKIFSQPGDAEDIMFRISAFAKKPLKRGSTLVLFDEVQECPEVVTMLKFLVEEGSYRYILTGSLLGVELRDIKSEPVGFMGVKEVYPLGLEEFFVNLGVSPSIIGEVEKRWRERIPVDEVVNDRLLQLFRLYLIIGGMPEAVSEYIDSNDLTSVAGVQADIVSLYRRDISKYAERDKLVIKEIFDLIPSELDAKNKRFILKNLNEHAKFERYKDSFLWLKDAGVALPVYNVSEPKLPLRLSENRNLFKLFSNDVGLLACQYAEGIQLKIIAGDIDVNCGAVYENAVAQELFSHGLDVYYFNSKRLGEVDFLVAIGGEAVAIEVKSGKDYRSHNALEKVMSCADYGLRKGYVFAQCNVEERGKICYFPVYMTMFVKRDNPTLGIYRVNLDGLTD